MSKDEGWVYIIQCGDFPYFKIGVSIVSGQSRLDAMQTGSPFDLRLVAQAHVYECRQTEAKIHKIFADRWHKGEWYALDALSLGQVITEMEQATHISSEKRAGDNAVMLDELTQNIATEPRG